MTARAETVVFWPGISVDIRKIREECEACARIAHSQRATHPVALIVPTTPFEAVATDFFDLLTNWGDVRRAKPKTR